MCMDINMDICLYIVCNVHNVFLCCISIWGCILYVPFYTLYILCNYITVITLHVLNVRAILVYTSRLGGGGGFEPI